MNDLSKAETRCTARRKSGEPCRNHAIKGATVCRMHGGSAPQVKAAAQVRILMAADRAAASLVTLVYDKTAPHAVRLNAARDLLDRAGLTARTAIDVEVAVSGSSKLAQNMAEVIVDYGEEPVEAELLPIEPPKPERPRLRPKRPRSYRSE